MQKPPMNDPLSSCSQHEPFALQVIGDSMAPEFPDECIVIIEPADWCQHGMYIMALVEGVRWFRQYLKDDHGEHLIALNDIYPPIELDGLEWKVEGIIMQRNLRRHQTPSGRREVKHYKYT
ncbi:MAG: S24 family peptidase [Gammaproteobacteria bacterium]|nr:S24 family peptidase [Gammaproteobacteria bacterium]